MVDLLDGLDEYVETGDHVRVGVVGAVLEFGDEVNEFVDVLFDFLTLLGELEFGEVLETELSDL